MNEKKRINLINRKNILTFFFIANFIVMGVLTIVKLQPPKSKPEIIINPIGYLAIDQNKTFLLKTSEPYYDIDFQVKNTEEDSIVLNGETEYLGELWGDYYAEGNFSSIISDGNYSITLKIDGQEIKSYNFEISNNVYLSYIDLLYKFFYYQRCGCEVLDDIVPGYVGHKACHLDDATNIENENEWVNLTGGWHDAGDYNKYHSTTAISLLGLAISYDNGKELFNSAELSDDYPILSDYSYHSNSISDLLEEIIWGADFVEKLVRTDGSLIDAIGSNEFQGWYGYWGIPSQETDGDNSTLDNRIYKPNGWDGFKIAAGLLKTAELLNETTAFRDKFSDRIDKYYSSGLQCRNYYYQDPTTATSWSRFEDLMLSDMSLYHLTSNQSYKDEADYIGYHFMSENRYNFNNSGFGHIGIDQIPAKLYYWVKFNGSQTVEELYTEKMEEHMQNFWLPLTSKSNANNFYHLLRGRHGTRGEFYFWDYTNDGWNVGHNSYYAVAAWAALNAYDITKNYEYLDFALRQIDWICGKNPFSLTMIEGVGEKNMPSYHNRAATINGNYNGAIPGTVPNGIIRPKIRSSETDNYIDYPWYDTYVSTIDSNHAEYMSNEMWIPHNSNFLLAITSLYLLGNLIE